MPGTPADLIDLLAGASAAAADAGRVIREVRESGGFTRDAKSDGSPVTVADMQADALLRSRLGTLFRGAAWLSEETADDPVRLGCEFAWIVDPLDGTKEFIEGLPQYAVAVALVQRGRPLLGVIHAPAIGDMYSCARGHGAHRNGEPMFVRDGSVMLASRTESRHGEFDVFADWAIQPVGSIALKLAMVACGSAAATLSRGPKWEWDVCAGALLVEEAGGRASDIDGTPFTFNQPWPKVRGVVAGAPASFDRAFLQSQAVGVSDRMAELPRDQGRSP